MDTNKQKLSTKVKNDAAQFLYPGIILIIVLGCAWGTWNDWNKWSQLRNQTGEPCEIDPPKCIKKRNAFIAWGIVTLMFVGILIMLLQKKQKSVGQD